MGFEHIVPEGLDHILFVLGLFLLGTRLKPLLWQITAFTVAHSLTLGLSLYGIVHLPSSIVEPVIAASIVFVAVENLFTAELKPWRPLVVFAFGLVHGLGFAGALKDLGLQRRDFLTALVGFNGGVELGQLFVVALALLAVGWLRSRPCYRRLVVVPASLLIAAVAMVWTIQRIV
jgi:hydrogenase/urease accessory protein HupE